MRDFSEEKFSDCKNIRRRLTEIRVGSSVAAAPKVTIIVPSYNVAEYVAETLDSIFAQTFGDYEIILVNDGSPDSAELEKSLAPYFDKITYAVQENLGAAQARNSAICLSRGELIAFLDGDDVWFPNYLESQVSFLEKENLEMVYSDAILFGEPLSEGKKFSDAAPSSGPCTAESLINGNCNVITSGTIVQKNKLVEFNMFDTKTQRTEDFDLWFRLAKRGVKIGYQTEVLLKYRVRISGLSGNNVERTLRSLAAFQLINDKYHLSSAEKKAWHQKIALCRAEYELEQGKLYLTQSEFEKAHKHLAEANRFYRKLKLYAVIWMLSINPKLAQNIFKKMRPAEFSFIAPK
jgi:glycosyltransferase involved in cell wall biosynthesis